MYPEATQAQFRLTSATGHRLLLRAHDPAWLVRYNFAGPDRVIGIYAAASMITP